jgi:hypothetical protein
VEFHGCRWFHSVTVYLLLSASLIRKTQYTFTTTDSILYPAFEFKNCTSKEASKNLKRETTRKALCVNSSVCVIVN